MEGEQAAVEKADDVMEEDGVEEEEGEAEGVAGK